MNKIINIVLLISCSLLFHSCKPLRTIINNEFPKLSTTDQQYIAVERNLIELENFEPHIGINITKDIIIQYLPAEIKKAAEKINDENVNVQNLEPTISMDKQGVFVEADFLITIPKYNAEIKGAFKGVTTVSTEKDSLYLRSALSSLKIKSIKFTKKPIKSKKALANLITPILKNYIENINGQLFKEPTVIYTGWGETYKLSLKEMFKDPNTEIEVDTLIASRHIKKSSIRIKSNGISVMVELMKNKPTFNITSIPTTTTRTEAEVSKIFKMFNDKYDSTWLSVFEPIDAKSLITANISKSEISNIFNEAFSKPITLKQKFTIPQANFNEKFEVKRGNIDCQKVRKEFNYNRYKRDDCDHGCQSWNLPCKAGEKACNIKEEAKVAADNLKWEAEKKLHDAANETRVAACNVWRETLDFLALGRFKGDVSGSGNANINFKSFNFNSDLSTLALQYNGTVATELNAHMELNPVDLGHVFFCYSSFNKNTSSNININIPSNTSDISINSTRQNENLILKIKLEKIPYEATINPSPLHSLLLDPQFAVQCPISTLLGIGSIGVATGKFLGMVKLAPEQELLLLGKVKGKYGIDEFQIPFKPITFKINGEMKKSTINWLSKSIQFTHIKP